MWFLLVPRCVLLFNLVIAMARLLLAYFARAPTVVLFSLLRCVSRRAFVGAYVVYYYTRGDRTGIFVSSFAFSSFRFVSFRFGVFVVPICVGVIVAWVPIHRSIDRSIDRPSSSIVSIVRVPQYPPGGLCNRSPDW